jgi:hypothetical protein
MVAEASGTACRACGEAVAASDTECPACGATQASGDPFIGKVLGDKYALVDRISRGGHCTVYEGRGPDGSVAIKILPAVAERSAEAAERLRREAKVLQRLVHPNVVRFVDFGETGDGQPWLAMELLQGETLEAMLIRVGTLSEGEVLTILTPICQALQAAHDKGIVHRDIKPRNILLAEDRNSRVPKLLDFGIAALEDADTLTKTETVSGTPQYMAPEQWEGLKYADARSDVYALGVIVYRALSGKYPYNADTALAWMKKSHLDPPVDVTLALGSRTVSPAVAAAVMKALSKNPAERPQSPMELLRALRPAPVGVRATRSPRAWMIATAVAAFLGTAGGFYAARVGKAPAAHVGAPVVLLMDTPVAKGVYDPDVVARGGTNADTISDLLGDMPVNVQKETVPSTWNRESFVLDLQPDLLVIHRSAFFHSLNVELGLGYEPFEDDKARDRWAVLYRTAEDKLIAFLGLVATVSPRTRFLIYSRGTGSGPGGWQTPGFRQHWVAQIDQRFPALRGRVSTMAIEGGVEKGSFRNAHVAEEIRAHLRSILGL